MCIVQGNVIDPMEVMRRETRQLLSTHGLEKAYWGSIGDLEKYKILKVIDRVVKTSPPAAGEGWKGLGISDRKYAYLAAKGMRMREEWKVPRGEMAARVAIIELYNHGKNHGLQHKIGGIEIDETRPVSHRDSEIIVPLSGGGRSLVMKFPIEEHERKFNQHIGRGKPQREFTDTTSPEMFIY